jgi:hypothetical protein
MNTSENTPRTVTEPRTVAAGPEPPSDGPDAIARLERQLDALRQQLEAAEREKRHATLSPWAWVGGGLQILAAILVAMAVSDWYFAERPDSLFIKLALAIVIQLGVLTACVAARGER